MASESVIMNVQYENGKIFKNISCEGHIFSVEPSPSLGGSGQYPNPIDYMTGALGSCSGIKLLMDLEAENNFPDSLKISIIGKRRETPPAVFENLHVIFFLKGNLDPGIIEKGIHEVMTLTCPVAVMLGKATNLTWEFSIEN